MKKLKVGTKTTILIAVLVFLSVCGNMVAKLASPEATMKDMIVLPTLLVLLSVLFYNLIKIAKSKQGYTKKYIK